MNSLARTVSATGPSAESDWFGQPRGLSILFLTEMWMQFSFFGMRAILVYYMTKSLMFPQAQASWVYGGYAAAVYFTPIFGGVISDRLIGRRNAVVSGGLMMAAGHFMLIFPDLFFPALGAIALGNGLFLPSLSSQISGLYAADDPRLASAYNIYYVGINLGAFLAPFVCGTLGEVFGWHWGFAAAGVGMIVGLLTYLAGSRYLAPETPRATRSRERVFDRTHRRRFLLLVGVMAVVVVFRGAYEQNGNTIAVWTDTGVDRRLGGGWSIPLTWFQALNPLAIFLGTPVLVAYWTRLGKRGREPSSVKKMIIGAAITAAAYALIAVVCADLAPREVRASWAWLTLFFVVFTIGELFILPVGLGLFGRLAPHGLEATAIAVWFFAGFAGNLLAGGLGTFWSHLAPGAFFGVVAGVAALSAVLLIPFVLPTARVEKSIQDS
ncbi:MAG TPA: peptide MFS transporter [Caulobacteraceae bacterium]|jgi:POT family proton-dependent oligopeptide transporter|nr:peptide MFS transporter [Caulobacteraceae bacterium]